MCVVNTQSCYNWLFLFGEDMSVKAPYQPHQLYGVFISPTIG